MQVVLACCKSLSTNIVYPNSLHHYGPQTESDDRGILRAWVMIYFNSMSERGIILASNRLPLFYAVTMLYWFTIYTYVPLLSPYVRSLGGSLTMSGIVIGAYGFSQMLLRIPLGIWSDRLQVRKPFIVGSIVVGTISSIGFALTSSVWLALVFRAMAGVAASGWVVFTVLYASYHHRDSTPRAMGVISFYTAIGQMLATTVGGLLAQVYGWHSAFWLAAGGGVAALLLSSGLKEEVPDPNKPGVEPRVLLAVGRDRIILGVSALAILAQVVTFSTRYGFSPQFAYGLGASKADLSWLTLVSTIPSAFAARYGAGYLASKIGERRVVMLGFVICCLFTAIIPAVHSMFWLYVTQAINGLGQGFCMPILMGLSIRHVAPDRRATAMGFYQAIYSLGMFGGPALTGFIGDLSNLEIGFFVVSGISLAAMILTMYLTPKPRRAGVIT